MRIDFKLILCSIILLASCQTRLSFEGRRYTNGVYWNITSSPHTKQQQSNIQREKKFLSRRNWLAFGFDRLEFLLMNEPHHPKKLKNFHLDLIQGQ